MKSSLSDIGGEGDHLILFGTDVLGSVDLVDDSYTSDGDENKTCNRSENHNYNNDDNENANQSITFHDAASHYSNCPSSLNNSIYEDARSGDDDCSESGDDEAHWIPLTNRPQDDDDNDKEEDQGEQPQLRAQNLESSSSSETQSCNNIGITEKAFGEVKDFWVWGKSNIFVLGNMMEAVEQMTEHVVQTVAGTTLHEVDSNLIRPHLQHVDANIVSPTFDVVTKIIQDTSHHLLHDIIEPMLEQLLSQRALLLENATLYGEDKMNIPSLSLAYQLRIDNVDQIMDYEASSGSITANSDCTDDSPCEGVAQAHITYIAADNDDDDDSAFFIGYHDYDDDLSACWAPLNAPPPSPVNLYESTFSTLS